MDEKGDGIIVLFAKGLNSHKSLSLSQWAFALIDHMYLEKVVREDIFTSIHIDEYSLDVRDTKLGAGT